MDHKAAFAGLQFHSSSFLQRPSGLLHCSVAEPRLQIKAFCASITVAVHSVLLGFSCFLPVFRYGVYRGQKALMRNENENLLVTHSFNYSRDKVYISHCCSQYVPMKLCYAVLFVFLSFKSIHLNIPLTTRVSGNKAYSVTSSNCFVQGSHRHTPTKCKYHRK